MICKTKEEADTKLGTLRSEMMFKYCPLAQGQCTGNCICYERGKVINHKNEFAVIEPSCTNVLISGTIYIEE